MKIKNILVTGGAGFIGSHIVDRLVDNGYQVTILDNLDHQVHNGRPPQYLNPKVKFIKGDITSDKDLNEALQKTEAVYHKAAAVGVGQSMYEIHKYININSAGTAKLLNFLANNNHNVKRIIIASSMSAYGEGLYVCPKCGKLRGELRDNLQMKLKDWELHCPKCEMYISPIPTPETERFSCNSIYAISKQSQEDMLMVFGRAYGIPVTAFRYFNVYGPRQSLSNPYTGVAAIFLSRLKNNNSPVVFEDGLQSRDFISVYDVADINILSLESEKTFNQVFNIGSGQPITIKQVAETLAQLLQKKIVPQITNLYRPGDVRHCFADITKINKALNWSPRISFQQGMEDLIQWSGGENAKDLVDKANQELNKRGLIKS